ncbi:MAG: putative glycoside hydrolase [Asticcacaulis sp.]
MAMGTDATHEHGIDISSTLSVPQGQWATVKITLDCFVTAGVDVSKVGVPFALKSRRRWRSAIRASSWRRMRAMRAVRRSRAVKSKDAPPPHLTRFRLAQARSCGPPPQTLRVQGGIRKRFFLLIPPCACAGRGPHEQATAKRAAREIGGGATCFTCEATIPPIAFSAALWLSAICNINTRR